MAELLLFFAVVIVPALVGAGELPPEPAPQSVLQAEWTAQCNDAVAALVSLEIPKREAIALVCQSPGTRTARFSATPLKIRGQGRGTECPGD